MEFIEKWIERVVLKNELDRYLGIAVSLVSLFFLHLFQNQHGHFDIT